MRHVRTCEALGCKEVRARAACARCVECGASLLCVWSVIAACLEAMSLTLIPIVVINHPSKFALKWRLVRTAGACLGACSPNVQPGG